VNATPGAGRPDRRAPIFGPEWAERHGVTWSHWDRWLCVVAVVDHGGDLAGLEGHLVDELRHIAGRDATEAKLSHLVDLGARLAAAGLTAAQLVNPDATADRQLVAKARHKLTGPGIEEGP